MKRLKKLLVSASFVFVIGIVVQGQSSNKIKFDKNGWNSEKLTQSVGVNAIKAKLFEISLGDKTRLRALIQEITKDGFTVITPENGLAVYIPYSQLKQIKSAAPVAEFSKLLENPSQKTYWENFFARTLNRMAIGYSYAIYQNGKPLAVGTYGYNKFPAFPENKGVPMSPQTRFQLASVSKPITAITLLHVMDQKGISPDTKFWTILKSQFPDLTVPGKGVEDITVAQLLTHTSGYPFGYVESPRLKNLRELLTKPVPNPSGEKYVYSNINFSIARTLIEVITGQDYEKYVQNEILRPAGIEGMRLQVDEAQAAFAYSPDELKGAPLAIDFRDEGGAYGWYATAEEVIKILGLVRSNTYLSPKMTKAMFERKLGWGASETPAGTAYRHDGQWVFENNRGVRTGIALLPDNVEAVLLTNTNARIPASELLTRGFSENIPRMLASNLDETRRLIQVEIPSHTDEIYCTTDGSLPTHAALLYLQPIPVQKPATVKCQGFLKGNPITFVNTLEVK